MSNKYGHWTCPKMIDKKGEKGKRGPGKLGVEIWFEYLRQSY